MHANQGWNLVCLAAVAWAAATAAAEKAGERSTGGGGGCSAMADCGSCLRTPRCRWCVSGNVAEKSRCEHETNIKDATWCNGYQWGPTSEYFIISNWTSNVQLFPQHAKLRLRVGETKVINITYNGLMDYPIDLYYLLDISKTMLNHTLEISRKQMKLTREMRNVTKNFRLGFGSFVDKVMMPFVPIESLEKECYESNKCDIPHSFKNHFPLDDDTKLFSEKLRSVSISTNNDSPEGGFDALMQAIVCAEKIKWRPDARHFLVFTTNDYYHIAGDGKLAGVVEPNPGVCMMSEENEYYGYKDYDYPTISQISRKAIEKNIIIIFMVTNSVSDIYKELSQKIKGSSVEILSQDSGNIINLITEACKKFKKSVKLIDDAGSQGIGIMYYSQCSGTGDHIGTNECNNIQATEVMFQAHITAKTCPPDLQNHIWETTINISPHGINETFQLDLEIFCSCPCEFKTSEYYEGNSSYCNWRGARKCGICECDDKSTGETCECDQNEYKGPEDDKLLGCISNDTAKTICSDHGTCICGKCLCHQRPNFGEMFYGKYCQCDNFSCKRHSGLLCSGRGQCLCGQCECDVGWIGDACQCPHMETGCVAPGEDLLCSGHGDCVCGKCVCKKDRSGKYCGDCLPTFNMTCPGGRCNEFAACVKCLVHDKDLCSSCSIVMPELKEAIIETSLTAQEKYCKVPTDDGCSFVFTYMEEPALIIRAVRTKECPSSNTLGIIIGISGAILFLAFIGILLWKLFTTIHDRREYARYTKELENTKWAVTDNPLHQEPTTTTMNPTYNARRSRFSFMLR